MEPSQQSENRATALQAAVARVLEEGVRVLEGALTVGIGDDTAEEKPSIVVIAPRSSRPGDPEPERSRLLNNALILVFYPLAAGGEGSRRPVEPAGRRESFAGEPRRPRGELIGPVAELRTGEGAEPVSDQVAINGLTLDFARHRATYAGNVLQLTKREFTLLSVLARSRGRVVSQAEIVREFGKDVPASSREASDLVKAVVLRTRRKLISAHADPHLIMTVRGVGYMIDSPLAPESLEAQRASQDPATHASRGPGRPRIARSR